MLIISPEILEDGTLNNMDQSLLTVSLNTITRDSRAWISTIGN